jgi:hypothetical protein
VTWDKKRPGRLLVTTLHKKRAGDEARTRDLLLGKEVFYQLNYARLKRRYYTTGFQARKPTRGRFRYFLGRFQYNLGEAYKVGQVPTALPKTPRGCSFG